MIMAAPKNNQYAKGNKGPPPSIYDDDFIENEAEEFKKWADVDKDCWIKDFAHLRGYSPQRFYEWKEKNKVFAAAFEYVKDKQERKFYYGAMTKELDMNFVKYFMPRILKDRPEWKQSFDMPTESTVEHIGTVTINRHTKPAK
jgi:hypothetical protein